MEFQTSQFDYLFILNIPIPISLTSGEILYFKTPSIYEYHQDINYIRLGQLFMTSLLDIELNPANYGFSADSYLDLILGTKMREEDDELFALLEQMTGIKITKESITCNGVPLREEDVLELRFAYLLSTGKVDINGKALGSNQDETEAQKRLRESEEKIKKLRGHEEKEEKVSFKQILTLIMYELNKSPKDLMELNFFGIYELYALASAATYDKISKVAAGNGLMDEKKPYKNILST